MSLQRWSLRISGVVQGVGFRPFVAQLADELGLAGEVRNDVGGAMVEVEGEQVVLDKFTRRLRNDAPRLAVVETIEVVTVPARGDTGFTIVASDETEGQARASIPPDAAMCDDCRHELFDPTDRRYRHPFITCTQCGPRHTIVTGIPYDRPMTTMANFPMCAACRTEYDDPRDRRHHAQPIACPDCGPALTFVDRLGTTARGDNAVLAAQRALRAGQIVAVKGVGGYHVACDTRNPGAVNELRQRKGRGDKPFALMVRDLETADSLVRLTDEARALLVSASAPIVVLPAREGAAGIVDAVAPRSTTLGVMLPYSPVHALLMAAHPDAPGDDPPDVLVMTSGNLADEPICIDPVEAQERLAGIADAWLHHDRPIHVACDDSVVRIGHGERVVVRRSRGYAPVPLRLPVRARPSVAVGGELKTTACVARGEQAWLSQHVGDTSSLETLALLERTVTTMCATTRTVPEVVVVDAHPAYLSSGWGARLAESVGADLARVQHHHAHLASLLVDRGVAPDVPVLGFAFDGTGYGSDGTIWGGEVLLGSYASVERVAHLTPISLPGGDAATRRPARVALAHLDAAEVSWDDDLPSVANATPQERAAIASMLRSGAGCTPTTSVGRLFDAISSLLGVCHDADYEGQAAVELEAIASRAPSQGETWTIPVIEREGVPLIDAAAAVLAAVTSVRAGTPSDVAARAFHEGLAAAIADVAVRVRTERGVTVVGLTGGVFQNLFLLAATARRLRAAEFTVLVHGRVPPNDGGLGIGQVAVVAARGQEG